MKLLTLALSLSSLWAADVKRIDPPAAPESGMPYLVKAPDGKVYLSWIDMLGGKDHSLRFSHWTASQWAAPETIATGNNWFVNWADAPSIAVLKDGSMLAHWLTRFEGAGKYGYGIRVAKRPAQSAQWKEIHGMSLDEPTDYAGFLSFLPGESKAVYLSPPPQTSAKQEPASHGAHAEHRKTLRFISFQDGSSTSSTSDNDLEVDADTCSCCPTTIGRTQKGLIAAYRDHQPGEIRDISIIRQTQGQWTKPETLHPDGWKINGCPTDGPSLATDGPRVAVAWLTRANNAPKIQIAYSNDNGEKFAPPLRLDSGNPLGRPAIVSAGNGAFWVLWLEKTQGEQNQILLRRVMQDGSLTQPFVVASVPAGRLSGFPRMALSGENIFVAWRDQQVRAALITLTDKERKKSTEE